MKPSIPKGTRDFSPADMTRRNYIMDTIRRTFLRYGFQQIETPAMENLSTLTGKYGDEGDQLLFRILNSRLHDAKDKESLSKEFERMLERNINSDLLTERALRYDLTVPFARYVVMHQNEITFPFRRYQVQPVWRADRPQKGRYREFYQCDADVIGTSSLLCEVELVQMTDEIFRELGVNITIKINNRKVLVGIAEIIGAPDKIVDITVAIDKIDKIGADKVKEELKSKGLSESSVNALDPVLQFKGDSSAKLAFLKNLLKNSETGLKGISEIEEVFALSGVDNLELDITLARGLNYYTGAILEVKANDVQMGSISGGGRYDDLTGIFGLPGVSGVGISYGIDRICDVMEELKLFDNSEKVQSGTIVLFVNFGIEEQKYCLNLLKQVRNAGIAAEIYPESAKMKKQLSYADANGIPYVVLVGSEEMQNGLLTVKKMDSGEQEKLSLGELINRIRKFELF